MDIIVQVLLLSFLSVSSAELKCRLVGLGTSEKSLSCTSRVLGKELKLSFGVKHTWKHFEISAGVGVDGFKFEVSYDFTYMRKLIASYMEWCDGNHLCRHVLNGDFKQFVEKAKKLAIEWRRSFKDEL